MATDPFNPFFSGTQPDPTATIAAAHIQAFKAVRGAAQQGGEDPSAQPPVPPRPARAIASADTSQPSSPPSRLDFNQDPGTMEERGYQQEYSAVQSQKANEAKAYQDIQDTYTTLGRFAGFQKDSYTNQRLSEMQPTADIDAAILKVRQTALYDQSALWEQLQGVPWKEAISIMDGRQNMYTKQIEDLAKMRETRLTIAKQQIGEEVDHITGQQESAKTQLEAANKSLEYAKSMGASDKELGALAVAASKAEKQLQKARKGGSGLATNTEMAQMALEDKWEQENLGSPPPPADSAAGMNIRVTAKRIARGDPKLMQEIIAAKGRYQDVRDLPANISGPTYRNPLD